MEWGRISPFSFRFSALFKNLCLIFSLIKTLIPNLWRESGFLDSLTSGILWFQRLFGACDRLRTCGHGLYDQQIVSGDLSTCAFFWIISDISFSFQHVVPRVEFMNSTRGIVSYSVGSLFSDKSISHFWEALISMISKVLPWNLFYPCQFFLNSNSIVQLFSSARYNLPYTLRIDKAPLVDYTSVYK